MPISIRASVPLLLLLACEARAPERRVAATPVPSATVAAPMKADGSLVEAGPRVEPKKYDLVEGKRVNIGGDVTVELKSVLYAHLANSRNSSLLVLDVTRGAQHEQVTLERIDPVGPSGPTYRPMMGVRVAIDYVDAYHQPSTGAILVLPQ